MILRAVFCVCSLNVFGFHELSVSLQGNPNDIDYEV